ncbi:hypothetical protein ABT218_05410 [Streptomyces sp. NPDC001455]
MRLRGLERAEAGEPHADAHQQRRDEMAQRMAQGSNGADGDTRA